MLLLNILLVPFCAMHPKFDVTIFCVSDSPRHHVYWMKDNFLNADVFENEIES